MAGFGSTPSIFNVTMTDANTEYSQALPTGTRKFSVSCMDGTAFRISFTTGAVASVGPWYNILANQVYESPDLDGITDLTVYAGCSSAAKALQIIAWQ